MECLSSWLCMKWSAIQPSPPRRRPLDDTIASAIHGSATCRQRCRVYRWKNLRNGLSGNRHVWLWPIENVRRPLNIPPKTSSHLPETSRARGYANRQRGLIPGTKAIAVTIGKAGDPIMAAVTVSGIAKHMTVARVNEIIVEVKAVTEGMELKLIRAKMSPQQ